MSKVIGEKSYFFGQLVFLLILMVLYTEGKARIHL